MTNRDSRKMLKSGILFAAVVAGVFALVFRNYDFATLVTTLRGADPFYIFLGIVCMCCFVFCESTNIGRVLKAMGYKTDLLQNLKYGASGFFFSGITPSASGGQPMQLYYMNKDKVELSHGSLSLLIELMGFQFVNTVLVTFAIIYDHAYISSLSRLVEVFVYGGAMICAAITIFLALVLFRPGVANKVERFIKVICLKLRKKKYIPKISQQLGEYRDGAEYIGRHPRILVKNIATTFIQLTALYSITYFVYCALGGAAVSWIRILSLQALLYAGVAMVPLPGGTGAGEGGFKLIFASVFGNEMLMPGMILSRGLSFYLCMIVTGIFLLVVHFKRNVGAGSGKLAGHEVA